MVPRIGGTASHNKDLSFGFERLFLAGLERAERASQMNSLRMCDLSEYVHLCHSESFEALSAGLQDALHMAGGVP